VKKAITLLIITMLAISLTGCTRKSSSVDDIKLSIKQIVKDVYAPKSIKQFKESYSNAVKSGLFTKEALDSLYVSTGDELNEKDLKRSCYVDVYYSNKNNNSEGISHYLAKLQLHGDGVVIKADIFFYISPDYNEERQTIIDRIVVSNIEKQ